jgi:hypothetical protein
MEIGCQGARKCKKVGNHYPMGLGYFNIHIQGEHTVYIKKILITYSYTVYVIRRCTNSGRQDARVTKFCLVEPNFLGVISVLFAYVTLLVCRLLKWLLDFFFLFENGIPLTESLIS